MANQWFRLYAEFGSDPKVRTMPDALQIRLVRLFCLRCLGPTERLSPDELQYGLGCGSDEALRETQQAFLDKGFIDSRWRILHWEQRQFASDNSNTRVKRYRDKREAAGLKRGSPMRDPALFERDGNRCIYCLSPLQLCIDHIFPIQLGGTDHYDNLATACKTCNSGKAGRTPEQAGYVIQNKEALERYKRYVTVNNFSDTVTVTVQNRTEQNRTEQNTTEIQGAQNAPSPSPTLPQPASAPAENLFTDPAEHQSSDDDATREDLQFGSALRQVFAYYVSVMQRNRTTYTLTPLRRKKGLARLEEALRMTHGDLTQAIELMKAVIDEVSFSDFHMGRSAKTDGKSYCEWEDHLFRSTEQFEKWVQRYQEAETAQKTRVREPQH